jgi:hypothetical protein
MEEAKSVFKQIELLSTVEDYGKEFSKSTDTGIIGEFIYRNSVARIKLMEFITLSNEFRWSDFSSYYKSDTFNENSLDYYLTLLKRVQSYREHLLCFREKVDRRTKIDNPIKILEFIKNSRVSKVTKLAEENKVMSFPTNMFPMFLLNKSS